MIAKAPSTSHELHAAAFISLMSFSRSSPHFAQSRWFFHGIKSNISVFLAAGHDTQFNIFENAFTAVVKRPKMTYIQKTEDSQMDISQFPRYLNDVK